MESKTGTIQVLRCGIKIDIFVIENTYDNKLLRTIHGLRSEAGLLMLSCYRMHKWKTDYLEMAGDNKKAAGLIKLKAFLGAIAAILPNGGFNHVQRVMASCRNNRSRYVVIPSGRKHFFGEVYERASYMPTIMMEFEDTFFRVSKGYDEYMTRLYGDYMTPPPETEREHHVLYDIKFEV